MKFFYHALDAGGGSCRGQIDALNRSDALEKLEHEGLIPLSLNAASNLWAKLQQPVRFGAESSLRLLPKFTLDLASLLSAAVPVSQALRVLEESHAASPAAFLAARLRKKLATGQRLAAAMELDEVRFPDYYIATVATAEEAGNLPGAMLNLGQTLDEARKVRETLKTALIYPAFLLAMVVLTMSLLVLVVLPRFEPLFEGASLPRLTRWVLGLSDLLGSPVWLWAISGAVALAVVFRRMGVIQKKHVVHVVAHLPIAGALHRDICLARWTRTLGTLTKSGIPLVRACELANPLIDDLHGPEFGRQLAASLRRGESFVEQLTATRFVPTFVSRLIVIGEESGRLAEMLEATSKLLSRRVHESVNRLVAFAVPVITLTLGGVIAVLVGAVFLGVLSLNQLLAVQ